MSTLSDHGRKQSRLHLVVDGTDGATHRGLLVISALTFLPATLSTPPITVLTDNDPAVVTAARALGHDSALNISLHATEDGIQEVLATASLFVSVAFKESHPSAGLLLARQLGIPTLTPIQFPDENAGAEQLALVRAAHDPRTLSKTILDQLDSPS